MWSQKIEAPKEKNFSSILGIIALHINTERRNDSYSICTDFTIK